MVADDGLADLGLDGAVVGPEGLAQRVDPRVHHQLAGQRRAGHQGAGPRRPVAAEPVGAGVDVLAVACLEEAMTLRQARIQAPIALLEGVISSEEAAQAVYAQLQVVVHDHWQIALLESLPASARR